MTPKFAHRKVFDLAALEPDNRDVIQQALNESTAEFGQIRQAADARVVVTSSSLRRLEFTMVGRDEAFVVEYRDDEPRHGIVKSSGGPVSVSWLPTDKAPAGGIEMASYLFDEPEAARDVFIASAEEALARHIFPGEDNPIIDPL